MKLMARLIVLILFSLVALNWLLLKRKRIRRRRPLPAKPKSETLELGKSYACVAP